MLGKQTLEQHPNIDQNMKIHTPQVEKMVYIGSKQWIGSKRRHRIEESIAQLKISDYYKTKLSRAKQDCSSLLKVEDDAWYPLHTEAANSKVMMLGRHRFKVSVLKEQDSKLAVNNIATGKSLQWFSAITTECQHRTSTTSISQSQFISRIIFPYQHTCIYIERLQ